MVFGAPGRFKYVGTQDFPEPQLPEKTIKAFQTAFDNIHAFHEAQKKGPLSVETMPGVNCRRLTRPIGNRNVFMFFSITLE